jgi:Fic family protein
MAGRWTRIRWSGQTARAWLPRALRGEDLRVPVEVARRTEQAAAAVRLADELLPGTWEPIVRVLLRTEGVASSDIEGVRAPIERVAVAEVDATAADSSAAWIADNLAVVTDAISTARREPLSIASLDRWHARLMAHSHLPPELIGRFRESQGWIGGASPVDAVYVPPPATAIPELMADLVEFANRTDLDPVAQAAVLHAQFETIHPYGDGNGRLGRVLVSWLLTRRLAVALPPPSSVLIARDPGGYLSGLYQFREGDRDRYLLWFADVVTRAGESSVALAGRIRGLIDRWQTAVVDLRSDSTARALVAALPEHPVLNAGVVAAHLDVSARSARTALEALAARGVIEPLDVPSTSPGRPRSWWVARELLDVVGSWAS